MSVNLSSRFGLLLLLSLIGAARQANAQDLKDRFNIRLSVTGLYVREDQPGDSNQTNRIVSPLQLAYGDLRGVIDARRLPGGFDLHADARVRFTGNTASTSTTEFTGNGMSFDPATSMTPEQLSQNKQYSSRGYLGSREYQITELWARGHWKKLDLGLGRMIIPEADAMRLDGARVLVHAHKHWDVGVYAGAYPDPYSRSINDDYVAGSNRGSGVAAGGGLSARYGYDRIYGHFSINALYLGGGDDGGALIYQPSADPAAPNILPDTSPTASTKIRSFVTWQNFWRPIKYLDFYHDLVVDIAGAAGVQLTRLDFFAAIHATKWLTIRLGYDHMSSIAIEMYLSRLLMNRVDFVPGTIENNMTLSRIARDDAHAALELQFGRTIVSADGHFRRRVLATPANDPQFLTWSASTYYGDQLAPKWGYEATLAVRNNGSLAGLRPSFFFTYQSDYRAKNIFAGIGLGRDFWHDRISLDFNFMYANTRDEASENAYGCPQSQSYIGPLAFDRNQVLSSACFGTRKGHNVQPSLTLAVSPARHWFLLFDYRLGVAISSDATTPTPPLGQPSPYAIPYVLTNTLLARVEAKY
jgi:hypothetical protein